MEFYRIALFLFIFQLVSVFVTTYLLADLGISAEVYFHEPTAAEMQTAETLYAQQISSTEITNLDPVSVFLGWVAQQVINTMNTIFNPLKRFVLTVPYLLINLGVHTAFAYLVGVIYWLVMLIGMAEFATGRSIEK